MINEEIHVLFIVICLRTLEVHTFETVERQNLSRLFVNASFG